jgi:hypothetical protein
MSFGHGAMSLTKERRLATGFRIPSMGRCLDGNSIRPKLTMRTLQIERPRHLVSPAVSPGNDARGPTVKYAIAILVGVVCLSVGIYGWIATHAMWHSGQASLLFDLRRLFGGQAISFNREKQPAPHWITMLLNIFLTTILTGFALGVLFLVIASIAAS